MKTVLAWVGAFAIICLLLDLDFGKSLGWLASAIIVAYLVITGVGAVVFAAASLAQWSFRTGRSALVKSTKTSFVQTVGSQAALRVLLFSMFLTMMREPGAPLDSRALVILNDAAPWFIVAISVVSALNVALQIALRRDGDYRAWGGFATTIACGCIAFEVSGPAAPPWASAIATGIITTVISLVFVGAVVGFIEKSRAGKSQRAEG